MTSIPDTGITRGAAKFYKSSDFAERGFCETCGSRLIYRAFGDPFVSVEVGSLDRPGDVTPEYHTGVEGRVPWLSIDDDLPRLRTDDNPEFHAVKAAAEGEGG